MNRSNVVDMQAYIERKKMVSPPPSYSFSHSLKEASWVAFQTVVLPFAGLAFLLFLFK